MGEGKQFLEELGEKVEGENGLLDWTQRMGSKTLKGIWAILVTSYWVGWQQKGQREIEIIGGWLN